MRILFRALKGLVLACFAALAASAAAQAPSLPQAPSIPQQCFNSYFFDVGGAAPIRPLSRHDLDLAGLTNSRPDSWMAQDFVDSGNIRNSVYVDGSVGRMIIFRFLQPPPESPDWDEFVVSIMGRLLGARRTRAGQLIRVDVATPEILADFDAEMARVRQDGRARGYEGC